MLIFQVVREGKKQKKDDPLILKSVPKKVIDERETFVVKKLTEKEIEKKFVSEIKKQKIPLEIPGDVISVFAGILEKKQDEYASMDNKISETVSSYWKIIYNSTILSDAFKVFKNERVATLFISYEAEFVQMASPTHRNCLAIFETLSDERLAGLFEKYTKELVQLEKEVGHHTDEIFRLLSVKKVADEFEKDPAKMANTLKAIERACGPWGYNVWQTFEALRNDKVVSLLIKYPETFVQLAQASKEYAYTVFQVLAKNNVATLFEDYQKEFVQIAGATKGWAPKTLEVLATNENVSYLFKKYTKSFVAIVEANGEPCDVFLNLWNKKNVAFFEKYSNELVSISQAAGNHSAVAFSALNSEKILPIFEKHVQEFVQIAKICGEAVGSAFAAFANEEIAKAFQTNSTEASR